MNIVIQNSHIVIYVNESGLFRELILLPFLYHIVSLFFNIDRMFMEQFLIDTRTYGPKFLE